MTAQRIYLVAALVLAVSACSTEPSPTDLQARLQEATEIAHTTLIVDTHVDVPYRLQEEYEDVSAATEKGHFDYPRARRGGLDAPFMSIYIPWQYEPQGGAKELADELIDMVEEIARKSPDKFTLAYSTEDVYRNFRDGKISLPLGMENGAPIEGDPANLRHFHERGIRYITLTHSRSNHIADSSYDDNRQWNGLSEFGKQLVEEMNRLGIMIDISHVSDEAFYQVIVLSETPVIASHSSARHFTPEFDRNMSDDMIVELADNGGVVQINFGSVFVGAEAQAWYQEYHPISEAWLEHNGVADYSDQAKAWRKQYREERPTPPASVDDVLDHIDYVVELVGIDHVGLGSDYDGVTSVPVGLEDVSTYPNLIAGLLARGYSEQDIARILSGNIMRVWSEVEAFATESHP